MNIRVLSKPDDPDLEEDNKSFSKIYSFPMNTITMETPITIKDFAIICQIPKISSKSAIPLSYRKYNIGNGLTFLFRSGNFVIKKFGNFNEFRNLFFKEPKCKKFRAIFSIRNFSLSRVNNYNSEVKLNFKYSFKIGYTPIRPESTLYDTNRTLEFVQGVGDQIIKPEYDPKNEVFTIFLKTNFNLKRWMYWPLKFLIARGLPTNPPLASFEIKITIDKSNNYWVEYASTSIPNQHVYVDFKEPKTIHNCLKNNKLEVRKFLFNEVPKCEFRQTLNL